MAFFLNDWLRNRNFPNVCFQRVFCRMVFCRIELISLLTFAEYKLPIVRFRSKLFPITKFPNIFCRIVLPNGSVSECLFCRMVFCRMAKLRIVVAEWPTLNSEHLLKLVIPSWSLMIRTKIQLETKATWKVKSKIEQEELKRIKVSTSNHLVVICIWLYDL